MTHEKTRSTIAVNVDCSEQVKRTLQEIDVHDSWTGAYRTLENEGFYSLCFKYLKTIYGPSGSEFVLDAGCGSGTKSIHLSRQGYSVVGIDLSQRILNRARNTIFELGLDDRAVYGCGDLMSLPFGDGTFGRALCWGVLMHVTNVEQAIAELTRVTRPGGTIVISEGNKSSLQSVTFRAIRRLLGRTHSEVHDAEAGTEYWQYTTTGRLVTRQADVAWLERVFASQWSEARGTPSRTVYRGICANSVETSTQSSTHI